jgi:hypothetical protein
VPEDPATSADTEGDDDTHDVPAELTELYEVLEYQRLVALGPNEQLPA